jgi:hypothetical protein
MPKRALRAHYWCLSFNPVACAQYELLPYRPSPAKAPSQAPTPPPRASPASSLAGRESGPWTIRSRIPEQNLHPDRGNSSDYPFLFAFTSPSMVWRVRQDSNLQPPDLESDALAVRATDPWLDIRPFFAARTTSSIVARPVRDLRPSGDRTLNFCFLMYCMCPATRAELLDCELLCLALLVLARSVIPPLAAVTRQSD